jgi:hypothetical protein
MSITPEMVQTMSLRDRVKLSLSMHSPLRCGGLGYDAEGNSITNTGRKWLDVVREHDERWRRESKESLEALDKMTDEEVQAKYGAKR